MRESEKRPQIIRKFNELGLSITALTNQQRTNFLDITFDLANDSYKPYRKQNDEPLYVNNSPNHPPPILRELPNSINKRINTLSCDKGTFDAAAPEYNEALRRSDFNAQLTYQPPNANTNTRRSKPRNVIWYNPPFSKNVKTNIAHKFLQLIDKHFPPSNKLSKHYNRHNVRVSYSGNENTRSFTLRHNKTVLKIRAVPTSILLGRCLQIFGPCNNLLTYGPPQK